MGWAVIQIVEPYHPEGDPNIPETMEFTHWIFKTQVEASRNKAFLLLGHGFSRRISVREVKREAWK